MCYRVLTSARSRSVSSSISMLAVPAGVEQPVNIDWAPTAQKISNPVNSSPCARADFQEEWPFIGPQVESCCFPLAQ